MENSSQVIFRELTKILKLGRYKLTNSDNTKNYADLLQDFSSNLTLLNEKINELLVLSTNLASECNEKSFEIRENSNEDNKEFQFVYRNSKTLKWCELAEMEEKREKLIEDIDNNGKYNNKDLLKFKELSEINGINIHKLKLPVVSRLNMIPPCLYWYNGDKKYSKGIYMSPYPNIYIKVPFLDVIDGTKDYNRIGSIKCKNGTKDECNIHRRHLAEKFNSEFRECTYAHLGDTYNKIGMNYRAPGMPSFGSFSTILRDMERVSYKDIKTMMMYALSDVLLCSIWGSANKINKQVIFDDIEICQ